MGVQDSVQTRTLRGKPAWAHSFCPESTQEIEVASRSSLYIAEREFRMRPASQASEIEFSSGSIGWMKGRAEGTWQRLRSDGNGLGGRSRASARRNSCGLPRMNWAIVFRATPAAPMSARLSGGLARIRRGEGLVVADLRRRSLSPIANESCP